MSAGSVIRVSGRIIYALCLAAIGAVLALGGAQLIALRGSPYYLAAGLAVLAAAWFTVRGRWPLAAAIYLTLMIGTLAWALAEAGLDGWALAPRLVSPFVLGLPFLLASLLGRRRLERLVALGVVTVAVALTFAVWSTSGFRPLDVAEGAIPPQAASETGEWPHFGNTQAGGHFSPLTQLTPANAGKLEQVWQYRIGPMPATPLSQVQAVPLDIQGQMPVEGLARLPLAIE